LRITKNGMNRVATRNWCTTTHDEWTGCRRVSDGCRNCCVAHKYEYLGDRVLVDMPAQVVFVGPRMDWLDQEIPEQWRQKLVNYATQCRQHTFMFLTKRPEHYTEEYYVPNVQYGISAENQEMLERRYAHISGVSRRFICAQPLLGPLRFDGMSAEFVAFGGETGRHAKAMKFDHLRSSIASAERCGIPVIVKQVGWHAGNNNIFGVDPREWPDDIRKYAKSM
jgi:protein gp37